MNILQPKIINNKTLAIVEGANVEAHKILYIGRVLEDSSINNETLYTNVDNDKINENLFGSKSEAFKNIKLAKSISRTNRIDIIPVKDSDDGTSGKASLTLKINKNSTGEGKIEIRLVSRSLHSYAINIIKNETPKDILSKIKTVLEKDIYLPLTIELKETEEEVSLQFLTLHKAAFVNNYVIEIIDFDKMGLDSKITAFEGGSDGTLTIDDSIFDKISKIRYQEIVTDGLMDYDVVESFLAKRWFSGEKIMDGHGWDVKTDSFTNLLSFADSKNGFNISVFYNKKENELFYKGSCLGETDKAIALSLAQLEALQYTDGEILTSIYPAMSGTSDLYGGVRQATLPYFNTLIPWMIPLREELGFNEEEISKLKEAGYCEIGNNIVNTNILRGECRTFFKTDAAGNPNTTYKFVNTKWTASKFSEYLYLRQRQMYPKNRMSDTAGQYDQTTTKVSFINDLKTIFRETGESQYGLLLTRTGTEATAIFVKAIEDTTKLDFAKGEITDKQLLAFNSQIRSIVNTLTPIFNINNE